MVRRMRWEIRYVGSEAKHLTWIQDILHLDPVKYTNTQCNFYGFYTFTFRM